MIRIRGIEADDIIPLLKDADLPYSDIEPEITDFLGAYSADRLIGAVGLQKLGEFGLLRSLVVLSDYRGKGYAKQLCDSVVDVAIQKEYSFVYLLCTDAEGFFENYGFSKIEKHKAPEDVQSTKQYSEICSDTAVVMKINLKMKRKYQPWNVGAQTWDYIENRYMQDWKDEHEKLLELVRHIKNSTLKNRLFGSTSMDKLVISIYNPIDYRKEALHIKFDLSNRTWNFKYNAMPFQKPEFERTYGEKNGIEEFDNFIKMIKW